MICSSADPAGPGSIGAMALHSLLARTTTTLCRGRAPSGPVCVAPRMSPASSSSSRRYTSQGGYWDKEIDRLRTDQHLRKFRQDLDLIEKPSRSDKIWSFMQPIAIALGLSVYTAACLGAGYGVGRVHGYCVGFVHGIKFPMAVAEMVCEAIDRRMKLDECNDDVEDGVQETIGEVPKVKLDESTDDDVEETIGEVAKVKLDESTDDDVEETIGEATKVKLDESTDDDVEETIGEVAKVKLDESTHDEIV